MKLLFLHSELAIGGAEEYIIEKINYSRIFGDSVYLIAKKGTLLSKLEKSVDFYNTYFRFDYFNIFRIKDYLKFLIYFFKVLKTSIRFKPDIIITQHSAPLGIANIINYFFAIPVLHVYHLINKLEYPPFIRLKNKNYFVVISKELENNLIEDYSIPTNKIFYVPNGFTQKIEIRNNYNKVHEQGELEIKYLGNLHEGKKDAIISFIEAIKLLSERNYKFKASIIGGGPLRIFFEKYTTNINCGRNGKLIYFEGESLDIYQSLKNADIVVGMGRSALEAMSMGIPTIIVGHLKGKFGGNYGGIINDHNIIDLENNNFTGRNSDMVTNGSLLANDIAKLIHSEVLRERLKEFYLNYILEKRNMDKLNALFYEILKKVYDESKN